MGTREYYLPITCYESVCEIKLICKVLSFIIICFIYNYCTQKYYYLLVGSMLQSQSNFPYQDTYTEICGLIKTIKYNLEDLQQYPSDILIQTITNQFHEAGKLAKNLAIIQPNDSNVARKRKYNNSGFILI